MDLRIWPNGEVVNSDDAMCRAWSLPIVVAVDAMNGRYAQTSCSHFDQCVPFREVGSSSEPMHRQSRGSTNEDHSSFLIVSLSATHR